MAKSPLQIVNEKCRAVYEVEGKPPLLQQITQLYRITIREFAGIFGISKAHAENIIKHRVFPSLELSLAISRYFECQVEELFGWRVDDDGKRRPLIVVDPRTNRATVKLSIRNPKHETMSLIREKLEGEKGVAG
jgi:DNA-binding XRE family transcriptional regulator